MPIPSPLRVGLLLAGGPSLFMTLMAVDAPTPPPGDYVSLMIAVDSPKTSPFPKTPWRLSGGVANNGVTQLAGYTVCPGGARDSMSIIREGQLSLNGKTLKAQFKVYDTEYKISTWTLEGVVEGGKATGTYTAKFLTPKTGAETSASGNFAGPAVPGTELAKTNAIPSDKDWPCWAGPTSNMTATPTGQKLVEDLTQARLIWRSQIAVGRGQGNYGHPGPQDFFSLLSNYKSRNDNCLPI